MTELEKKYLQAEKPEDFRVTAREIAEGMNVPEWFVRAATAELALDINQDYTLEEFIAIKKAMIAIGNREIAQAYAKESPKRPNGQEEEEA